MSDISIEETSIVIFGAFGVFVLELLEFLGLLFLFYYLMDELVCLHGYNFQ